MYRVSDGIPASTVSDSSNRTNDPPQAGRSGRQARVRRRRENQIGWGDIISGSGWIKIVILTALILWLYSNEVWMMVRKWIDDPNWSHGFLIPLFSLYFLHQRRRRLASVEYGSSWLGLVLMLLCFLGYVYSVYPLKMGYPRLLMFLGTIFAVVWCCCGWRVIQVTWLPILYLFFALPLPRRLYVAVTTPMRAWASNVAAAFLNLIPHMQATARGVVIEGLYRGKDFDLNVAEACAGMRLMMAFVALGVAMAYLSDRPYWHRIVLVLFTFPIALFCNFLRVTITGVLYVMVDPMFAKGGFHTTLGLLMLPVAFMLYWLIATVLNMLYIEETVSKDG